MSAETHGRRCRARPAVAPMAVRCALPRGHTGQHMGWNRAASQWDSWGQARQADAFDEAPEPRPGQPPLFHPIDP